MIVGSMLLGMVFMSPMLAADGAVGVFVALGSALAGVVLIVVASEATVPLRRRILASVREGREQPFSALTHVPAPASSLSTRPGPRLLFLSLLWCG